MSTYTAFVELAFERLNKELAIPKGFAVALYKEEDSWSFISKLAQLVEAVFTRAVVDALREPLIFDVISNLAQEVRINFLRKMNIIDSEQKSMFKAVAEIRNQYIHDLSNIDVPLDAYIKNLEDGARKGLFKRFKPYFVDPKMSIEKFISQCRPQVFHVCVLELLKVHGKVSSINIQKDHEAFRLQQAGRLLPAKKQGEMLPLDRLTVSSYVTQARDVLKREGLFVSEFK
ncbi:MULTISPECIES: hypothetical protein [Stenotrophomonas]|uniref:hypothetical protein n=1 Tax=Stenotrophomonas TaxID=40323 RepID=UPI001F1F77C9|nr:hypothetical protein [Stenotrophomonas maltophilia]MCF3526950.1 hypothetical protein [Stenotrophomonas maltophilia]MCF3554221.1 hypothetical protein [Stenotrophomonas maltophilia]